MTRNTHRRPQHHRLVTDGGEDDAKIVGEMDEGDGTGIVGRATGDGETYGVKGEADSAEGYGFYTPDDVRIEGAVDGDTSWSVEVTGSDSDDAGAVVMGHPENSDEDAPGATVSGGGKVGAGNTVSGDYGTVSGGSNNEASATGASVLGGFSNVASGYSAIATGTNANATHDGSFVIGDSSSTEVWSSGADEVRSQMPMYAPEFNTTSARAAKTAVSPVEPESVLSNVESLSLNTWEFTDHEGVRHMGPMAEEFSKMFELGRTDESIATVDADGVALAAIQGLAIRQRTENERLQEQLLEKDERISELESTLDALQTRLSALEDE